MRKKIFFVCFISMLSSTFVANAGFEQFLDTVKNNKLHSSIIASGSFVGSVLLVEAILSNKNDKIIWNLFKSFCTLWRDNSRDYIKEQLSEGNYRLVFEVFTFWLFLFGESVYWSYRGVDKWIEIKADKKVRDSIKKGVVTEALLGKIVDEKLEEKTDKLRKIDDEIWEIKEILKSLASRTVHCDGRLDDVLNRTNKFRSDWNRSLKASDDLAKHAIRKTDEALGKVDQFVEDTYEKFKENLVKEKLVKTK